jgi:hypothetical protein
MIRKSIVLILLVLVASSPTSHAADTYTSIAQALSSGDLSAASRLISANKGVSAASSRQIAISNALSNGNLDAVREIIQGPVPTPNASKSIVQSQTQIALNALSVGDIDKVAIAVYGQDAVIATALTRGDIAGASKAIQDARAIDKQIVVILEKSGSSNSQPGSSNSQPGSSNSQPGSSNSQPGSSNSQSLIAQAEKFRMMDSALVSLKKSINVQLSALDRILALKLTKINDKDKQKFLNSDIWNYNYNLVKNYASASEPISDFIRLRVDQNWYNTINFNLKYEVEKIITINQTLSFLQKQLLTQLPNFQCQNVKNKSTSPLLSKNSCPKGSKKVAV